MNNTKAIDDILELFKSPFRFETYNETESLGIFLNGFIDLIDPKEGFIWESYEVKILIHNDYPEILPKTYLVSKNIPFDYDRHIGTHGSCCIAPNAEEYLILGRNYNLINYIEKLVIPFFATQKLYDLEGKWPIGEYSHFTIGLIEYYKEKLELDSIENIDRALQVLSYSLRIGRNDLCFCESGRKYKKCHLSKIELFNFVPKRLFKSDLKTIREHKM